MYRTYVIVRHTFTEAVVQPIYSLVLALGTAILVIFAMLPFFTLGEDTKMFKAVGLDVMLLLVLISTLFATSKSIFDEIEDRTMLTLMSKPVFKWEVLVGKYIGIVLSALMAVAILGTVLTICLCMRIPGDNMLRSASLDEREIRQIHDMQLMHVMGLLPSLVLMWLQISVLAAIGVALSTRFSLVVNLPVVLIFYIAGNLTRFLFASADVSASLMQKSATARFLAYMVGNGAPGAAAPADRSPIVKFFVFILSLLVPYLQIFDLRSLTVYKTIRVGQTFSGDPQGVYLGVLWSYVGVACLYCLCYTIFSLSVGMWLFEGRELGGAEG